MYECNVWAWAHRVVLDEVDLLQDPSTYGDVKMLLSAVAGPSASRDHQTVFASATGNSPGENTIKEEAVEQCGGSTW